MTNTDMLEYFLDNDFLPYLIETFLDTALCKHEETLEEFIIDLKYDFKRYGFERFSTLLDPEDFTYFPELEGILREWPDQLYKMLKSADVLKIHHNTDSSCTFSTPISKNI